jgi:hypothetical protein
MKSLETFGTSTNDETFAKFFWSFEGCWRSESCLKTDLLFPGKILNIYGVSLLLNLNDDKNGWEKGENKTKILADNFFRLSVVLSEAKRMKKPVKCAMEILKTVHGDWMNC